MIIILLLLCKSFASPTRSTPHSTHGEIAVISTGILLLKLLNSHVRCSSSTSRNVYTKSAGAHRNNNTKLWRLRILLPEKNVHVRSRGLFIERNTENEITIPIMIAITGTGVRIVVMLFFFCLYSYDISTRLRFVYIVKRANRISYYFIVRIFINMYQQDVSYEFYKVIFHTF